LLAAPQAPLGTPHRFIVGCRNPWLFPADLSIGAGMLATLYPCGERGVSYAEPRQPERE
jgi:hypothetical protein